MQAAGFLGMGVDVDGCDLLDIGQVELGHLAGSGGWFRGDAKLIIPYNEFRNVASCDRLGSRAEICL
jgi:hypothetical protein